MNNIDLHVHSIFSDGEKTPNELLNMAVQKRIKFFSITDHDTLKGNKNLKLTKKNSNLILISGIELSSKVENGKMHILGYDFDINDENLNKKMNLLHQNSFYSTISILSILKSEFSIVFPTDDLIAMLKTDKNLGRPDIAKLLIKYNYVKTTEEAFKKYLNFAHEKIGNNKKGIAKEECLELIKKAQGLAVLAHPKSLKLDFKELDKLLYELKEMGLDGIEAYHNSHSKEEIVMYEKLAKKYDLLTSLGSDYHGPTIKPDINMLSGKNNNLLNYEPTITKVLTKTTPSFIHNKNK